MTELDRLPPDQRAVLSLVLDRGKSYVEVAEMLAIPESSVRDRAHAALDALAKDAGGPPPASPAGSGTRSGAIGASRAVRQPTRTARPSAAAGARGPVVRTQPRPPSSRLAGALLLGAIVAVIVVAAILLSGGGKGSGHTSTTPPAASTSTSTTGKPTLNKTIALTPVEPSLKASGTAYVLSESGRSAFYISAQGLPPSSGFFYAVWLYNSPSSSAPLGRAPNVGADGRMQGGNPLPSNPARFRQLVITRETSTHPTHPGPIVLRGTFALH